MKELKTFILIKSRMYEFNDNFSAVADATPICDSTLYDRRTLNATKAGLKKIEYTILGIHVRHY